MKKTLSGQQELFIEYIAQGFDQTLAAKKAGYAQPRKAAQKLMNGNPLVQAEVQRVYRENAKSLDLTRDSVKEMVMAAYELAAFQCNPEAMIRACGELSKMCGFYAPEKHEIHLTYNQKQLQERLQTMSDDELLGLRVPETVEGEYERVSGTEH